MNRRMKQALALLTAALLVAAGMYGAFLLGQQNGREMGRDTGYENGYDDGYDDGHSDGYDDGYADGRQNGSDAGYSDGYDDGYADGSQDGHADGYDDGYECGAWDAMDAVLNWAEGKWYVPDGKIQDAREELGERPGHCGKDRVGQKYL